MPVVSIRKRHLLPAVTIVSRTFRVVEWGHQWLQSQGQIRALPLLGRILGLADLVELYWMLDPRVAVSGRHPDVVSSNELECSGHLQIAV